MNLGKTITLRAMTLGLSFGGLALGACGSTPATKDDGQTGANGTTPGGEKPTPGGTGTTPGGEKKDPATGGEHTCGAGSCGKLVVPNE